MISVIISAMQKKFRVYEVIIGRGGSREDVPEVSALKLGAGRWTGLATYRVGERVF